VKLANKGGVINEKIGYSRHGNPAYLVTHGTRSRLPAATCTTSTYAKSNPYTHSHANTYTYASPNTHTLTYTDTCTGAGSIRKTYYSH
jgi:hypothetical protein